MSTSTTYADAEEVREAYLEGDLTEDELEDALDDEEMHAESDAGSWHDDLMDSLKLSGIPWRLGGVTMFMTLWLTVALVIRSLGESGAIGTEVAEMGGILLGMTPIFAAAMFSIFDDVIEDAAAEFRLVRQFRYLLSVGGAALIYSSPAASTSEVSAVAVEMHSAMSLAAALWVLGPAVVMWCEDNRDLLQKWNRRLEKMVGS